MSVVIRPIEQKDKAQWLVLWQEYLTFYKATLADEIIQTTWSRFFDESSPVFAAVAVTEDDPDTLTGFVTYVFQKTTWLINDQIYLHDLYVSPTIRNKGTGRKLIEYVYSVADKEDIQKVYWHTQRFNHRAQLLYTKVGVRDDFVSYQRPKK